MADCNPSRSVQGWENRAQCICVSLEQAMHKIQSFYGSDVLLREVDEFTHGKKVNGQN
jgi:hypothetical protein